jgi:hypothetical protein
MSEVLTGAIVVLAGLIYGCSGFGFGLVLVPGLALFLEPRIVVPLTTLVSLPMSLLLLFGARRGIRLRLLVPLVCGALLGLPAGVALLHLVPAPTMRIAVGVVSIIIGSLLLSGRSRPMKRSVAGSVFVGSLAGLMGAGAGVPGPPILLFLANQGERKEVFRATLVAFFLTTYFLNVGGYWFAGLLDQDLLLRAAKLAPLALLGSGVGALLSRRFSDRGFRTTALVLVVVAGLALLISSL